MSKKCYLTKKKTISGNKRSNSMIAFKRKFYPNLQNCKFWSFKLKKFIKLRISTKGIRLINKKGIDYLLNKII